MYQDNHKLIKDPAQLESPGPSLFREQERVGRIERWFPLRTPYANVLAALFIGSYIRVPGKSLDAHVAQSPQRLVPR